MDVTFIFSFTSKINLLFFDSMIIQSNHESLTSTLLSTEALIAHDDMTCRTHGHRKGQDAR